MRNFSTFALLLLAACTSTGGSTPGEHTISTAGYATACHQDTDCVPVYEGDVCAGCNCANAAIAASAGAAYQAAMQAEFDACGKAPSVCACTYAGAACLAGTCVFATPSQVCNGSLSPQSCSENSALCLPGDTCKADSDPTTCHPSQCNCTSAGWACSQDCLTNGSTCVKGN